jgi:hypothetical protein
MDKERFQQMEKWLNEQAEATRAMNETLNKFIAIMGNQEAARNVAPPPSVPTPLVITSLQVSQPSRVKLGIVMFHIILTSETLLTSQRPL